MVFDHWDHLRTGAAPDPRALLPVLPDLTYLLTADIPTLISRHHSRLQHQPHFTLALPLPEQLHRYHRVAQVLRTPVITSDESSLDHILDAVETATRMHPTRRTCPCLPLPAAP